jgi:hypothetical protein
MDDVYCGSSIALLRNELLHESSTNQNQPTTTLCRQSSSGFWHDYNAEFAELLSELALENVTLINVNNTPALALKQGL